MATSRRAKAAKPDVQRAQRSAVHRKALSHLPVKTRAEHRRRFAQDPRGAVRGGPAARPAGPAGNGPR